MAGNKHRLRVASLCLFSLIFSQWGQFAQSAGPWTTQSVGAYVPAAGHYQTRWRTWPGEARPSQTFPQSVGAERLVTPPGFVPPPVVKETLPSYLPPTASPLGESMMGPAPQGILPLDRPLQIDGQVLSPPTTSPIAPIPGSMPTLPTLPPTTPVPEAMPSMPPLKTKPAIQLPETAPAAPSVPYQPETPPAPAALPPTEVPFPSAPSPVEGSGLLPRGPHTPGMSAVSPYTPQPYMSNAATPHVADVAPPAEMVPAMPPGPVQLSSDPSIPRGEVLPGDLWPEHYTDSTNEGRSNSSLAGEPESSRIPRGNVYPKDLWPDTQDPRDSLIPPPRDFSGAGPNSPYFERGPSGREVVPEDLWENPSAHTGIVAAPPEQSIPAFPPGDQVLPPAMALTNEPVRSGWVPEMSSGDPGAVAMGPGSGLGRTSDAPLQAEVVPPVEYLDPVEPWAEPQPWVPESQPLEVDAPQVATHDPVAWEPEPHQSLPPVMPTVSNYTPIEQIERQEISLREIPVYQEQPVEPEFSRQTVAVPEYPAPFMPQAMPVQESQPWQPPIEHQQISLRESPVYQERSIQPEIPQQAIAASQYNAEQYMPQPQFTPVEEPQPWQPPIERQEISLLETPVYQDQAMPPQEDVSQQLAASEYSPAPYVPQPQVVPMKEPQPWQPPIEHQQITLREPTDWAVYENQAAPMEAMPQANPFPMAPLSASPFPPRPASPMAEYAQELAQPVTYHDPVSGMPRPEVWQERQVAGQMMPREDSPSGLDMMPGLDGFCPVALVDGDQWVPGDPQWVVVHQGRSFLTSGPDQQLRFMSDPQRYAPVFGGNDPVLAVDENRQVTGLTDFCVVFNGRLHMFSDASTLDRFQQDPARFIQRIGMGPY